MLSFCIFCTTIYRPQLPECICSRSYENDQQIHKCDKCRRLENDSMANDFLENPQVHKRSENLIVSTTCYYNKAFCFGVCIIVK